MFFNLKISQTGHRYQMNNRIKENTETVLKSTLKNVYNFNFQKNDRKYVRNEAELLRRTTLKITVTKQFQQIIPIEVEQL